MQLGLYEIWQIGSLLVLAAVVTAALVSDLRHQRVPNTLVMLGLGLGLCLHTLGPRVPGGSGAGLFTELPSALGFTSAALGGLAGLLMFLPLYVLRAMGAGDVKLMAAIGSFTGTMALFNVSLCVLAMGGVLALVRMAWKGGGRQVLGQAGVVLVTPMAASRAPLDSRLRSGDRMPYVPAIAAGLLAYGAWIFSGHTPWIGSWLG